MDQTNWLTLIGNLGFPIIVSWYLLTRVAESNPLKQEERCLIRGHLLFEVMVYTILITDSPDLIWGSHLIFRT
jgi:hypothetical protein